MSIALHQEIKVLREQVQELSEELAALAEQLAALEPVKDLDIDTLQPKRRPGRPRKDAQQ